MRGPLEAGGEPEGAADIRLAGDADIAAHQMYQPLADGESQASSAVLAGHRAIRLFEGVEQPLLLRGRHADAAVLNLETHHHALLMVGDATHPQVNGAGGGKLDRVADQIEQDLAETQRVAAQG